MSPRGQRSVFEAWAKLVAKAWKDQEYERKLLADPRQALLNADVEIPAGLSVTVVRGPNPEPRSNVLALPYPESADQLSDEDLDAVAGGLGIVGRRSLDSSGVGELTALHGYLRGRISSLNPTVPGLLADGRFSTDPQPDIP